MENIVSGDLEFRYELILTHLLDKICLKLNVRDLYRVGRVCKAWNEIVERELLNRGMQRLVLHENVTNADIINQLRVEPYIALLFTIQKDFEAEEFLELPDSNRYMKLFPGMIMAVGAAMVYTEKHFVHNAVTHNEKVNYALVNPGEIPCLIIPKHENFDIKCVRYTVEQIRKKSVRPKAVVDDLMPKDKDSKTILMLYVFNCKEKFIKKILDCISKQYEKDKYVLWGSELFISPFVNNSKDEVNKDEKLSLLGISISSPNIDLFSTVFPCENMKITEIYNDLSKFRDKVELKKHSIALISGPVFEDFYDYTSNEEEMKDVRVKMNEFYTEDYEKEYLYYFKEIFPEVGFISTFQDTMLKTFGLDKNGSNQFLKHNEAITIVIVTFD